VAGNEEIMRILGRLEEGVDRLRADFTDEKEHSAESRGRMHTKLEKIEEDVGIVGKVAAQARDKADAVGKIVSDDVKPVTDDVKRWRQLGLGLLGIIGIAGTALGISMATVGDQVATVLRHWLGFK
jgi:hypothetical protein